MHANPDPPDDLSELERRLTSWQPAADGLDADAMLFAAGRAAARPGPLRLLWPALTCALAGLALFLSACLKTEHDERLALARLLERQAPAPAGEHPPAHSPVAQAPPTEELPPTSLLAAHQALEEGVDSWQPPAAKSAPDSGPPAAPVLQVRQLDLVLGP